MRKITILNLCGYELVKSQLHRMGINVAETKHKGTKYKMFDAESRLVADIDCGRNKAQIYDYGRA